MATAQIPVEKTITCPAEKVAQVVLIMNQLGFQIKGTAAGATAGTVAMTADLTDQQVKALQDMISKLERRETVANILNKAGKLTTKTVNFAVNDVLAPGVGLATTVATGIAGTGAEFACKVVSDGINKIAETGVQTVQNVRVSPDAQKLKGSLKTIGSCFGLFDSNESDTIKIA